MTERTYDIWTDDAIEWKRVTGVLGPQIRVYSTYTYYVSMAALEEWGRPEAVAWVIGSNGEIGIQPTVITDPDMRTLNYVDHYAVGRVPAKLKGMIAPGSYEVRKAGKAWILERIEEDEE